MPAASGAYRNIASTMLKWAGPPAKIFDFGAGPCDKTAVLSALGYECTACDDLADDWHKKGANRQKIIAFARESGIRFVPTEGLDGLPFSNGEFDVIMMSDVLEHLHDSPRELLTGLLQFLKPAGLFFATVPNAVNLYKRLKVLFGETNLPAFESYYWYPDRWRGHVREYSKRDLTLLCSFVNLEIVELRGAHHALHAVPPYLRAAWVAATQIVTGGRDTWSLVARKPRGWSPRTITPEELDAIMGRYTSYKY